MNTIATKLFDANHHFRDLPTRLRETPDLLGFPPHRPHTENRSQGEAVVPAPDSIRGHTREKRPIPAPAPGALRLPGLRIVGIFSGPLAGALAAILVSAWPGAAAPLAWAFGWLYLAWAVDASRPAAAIMDGLLGLAILAAGLLIGANPAGPMWLFAAHAAAWPLRALVRGRDARSPLIAALWISFHAAMTLLLL